MKKIIFSLSTLFCVGILSAQTTEVKPVEEKAEISFISLEHNYGTMEYDANGTYEFEFTNTGKLPLTLLNVVPSCGCTAPEWSKEPIKPSEKGKIKVTYNTKIPGTFGKQITVYSNASTNPILLKIKGEVKPQAQQPQQEVK
ncbi:MAG: DUF1573 domain-containing protein [Tenuifilaceae bacterium]